MEGRPAAESERLPAEAHAWMDRKPDSFAHCSVGQALAPLCEERGVAAVHWQDQPWGPSRKP